MPQIDLIKQSTFFTVYLSHNCLELYPGIEDRSGKQVIHSSRSYECASEFAQTAATHRGLELKDYCLADL